ncbi:MAG: hypothetical protein DMG40_03565 [Acidobacteria bacterium]|nr:MAG: hypothetical protein DMG40_03565 [Acidobacteriota bacterium]
MLNSKSVRGWLSALGVSLATAFLVVSPFFWRGNASGHDIAFHASSWLDVAGQWKEGIVFPRWCEWANNGFGEPRFIFYPPLSWMLGAALGLVAPWNAVPGIFVVLAQTLAGSSMFVLGRRFFSAGPALFGAACYAANPYALLLVYMRSDFAEELACALLPLLLLAAVQLCGLLENHWRSGTRVTAIFALLFAGVWLCNAPAGVVASYSLTLLLVYAALAEKSLAPLWRGAGGLALGFALAGFYLFPAAYEQPWVNIGQALSSGLQPVQNFLYTATADPEHNAFNWIASSVAVLLVGMTAIVALLARRTTENPENEKVARRIWPVMVMLGAAATILMLRPRAVDGHPCCAIRLLCPSDVYAASRGRDLDWCGDPRGCGNGHFPGSQSLVGFRRYSRAAGCDCEWPGLRRNRRIRSGQGRSHRSARKSAAGRNPARKRGASAGPKGGNSHSEVDRRGERT